MNLSGITWRGESPDDIELLRVLPKALVAVLSEVNGFILYSGALHVRGASRSPDWHALYNVLEGSLALHRLYETVKKKDIPFAQDQLGDQFLLRDEAIFRLDGETGEVTPLCKNLTEFLERAGQDVQTFLNVNLDRELEPGKLWLAFPPLACSGPEPSSLKPCPISEVIRFHADFARSIANIPDGGEIEFEVS